MNRFKIFVSKFGFLSSTKSWFWPSSYTKGKSLNISSIHGKYLTWRCTSPLTRKKNEHQVLISRTDSMKKNAYFIQILIILNSIDVIWFSTYFEWRNPEMWGLLTFSGAAHRLNKMILNPPTLLNGRWKLQTAKKVREKAITAIFRLSRSEIRLYFRVRFATNSFPISNNSASDMNCLSTVHIIPVLIVYWEEINKIRLF